MLTLNEEFHLPGAIENVRDWAEDIFIVDSRSTDRTVDIALEQGIKVVQRPFTNFGDQWNFALESLPITTPWTLKLDPDERITDPLKADIAHATSDPQACEGYAFPRRLWFLGKPLHVQADVVRLWRTGKCRFSDVIVNEHPLIDGQVGRLKGILEHLDCRDLHQWVQKQNLYSTMEAIAMVRGDPLAVKPRLFGSPLERRMFLKSIFFKVPFRYKIQMLHELFVRGAWRDGRLGMTWARCRVEARRMRELKASEMRATGRVPELCEASAGDFDPRVLDSLLQQQVLGEGTRPRAPSRPIPR